MTKNVQSLLIDPNSFMALQKRRETGKWYYYGTTVFTVTVESLLFKII